MAFKKILQFISSILGSLFLSIGVLLVVSFFLSSNINKNIDLIDDTILSVSDKFLEENKVELRNQIANSLEGQMPSKDELKLGCNKPQIVPEGLKPVLTTEFCSELDSMSDESVKNRILDYLIESNLKGLTATSTSSEESRQQIREALSTINPAYLISPIILGIILFVLGSLLILVSTGFNLIKGLYKISLKTSINLFTVSLFLFMIFLLSPRMISDFLNFVKDAIKIQLPEMPVILLDFVSTIFLEWIKLSTNPVLIGTLIALVPFVAASVFLYIKKRKLDENAKVELKKK